LISYLSPRLALRTATTTRSHYRNGLYYRPPPLLRPPPFHRGRQAGRHGTSPVDAQRARARKLISQYTTDLLLDPQGWWRVPHLLHWRWSESFGYSDEFGRRAWGVRRSRSCLLTFLAPPVEHQLCKHNHPCLYCFTSVQRPHARARPRSSAGGGYRTLRDLAQMGEDQRGSQAV